MAQLKQDIELSAQYTNEHASIVQQRYTNPYNLCACDKRFDEGVCNCTDSQYYQQVVKSLATGHYCYNVIAIQLCS